MFDRRRAGSGDDPGSPTIDFVTLNGLFRRWGLPMVFDDSRHDGRGRGHDRQVRGDRGGGGIGRRGSRSDALNDPWVAVRRDGDGFPDESELHEAADRGVQGEIEEIARARS